MRVYTEGKKRFQLIYTTLRLIQFGKPVVTLGRLLAKTYVEPATGFESAISQLGKLKLYHLTYIRILFYRGIRL